MTEKDDDKLLNPDDIKDLVDKESAKGGLTKMAGILVALVVAMMMHNAWSIYLMLFDDTIPLVQCPKEFDLDRPVILKRFDSMTKVDTDNWVKGFVINYVNKLYPRTAEDAKPFFEYIRDHSTGLMSRKYAARVSEIDSIKKEITSGSFVKFWVTNSESIKIRKVSEGEWSVVVYGYLHKRSNGNLQKAQPRVELTVDSVGASRSNPEGLVVSEIRVVQISDPISGAEIEL